MEWKPILTSRQWTIEVADDGSYAYRVVNVGPDGTHNYYMVMSGQYGEPLFEAEPDLAVPVPVRCTYRDAQGAEVNPDQKIAGLICRDAAGAVAIRVSLTNARNQGLQWELDDDGVLRIGDETFHLYALVLKDKKRFRNYDAFFSPEKPDEVQVLELEDLV